MQQTDFGLAAVSFLSSSYLVRCSVCFSLLLLPFNTIPVATKSFWNLIPEVNKSFRLFAVFSSTNTNCFSVPKQPSSSPKQSPILNLVRVRTLSGCNPDDNDAATQTSNNRKFPVSPRGSNESPPNWSQQLILFLERGQIHRRFRFVYSGSKHQKSNNKNRRNTVSVSTLKAPAAVSHWHPSLSHTHIHTHTRSAATTKKNSFSRQQKSPSKNFPTF